MTIKKGEKMNKQVYISADYDNNGDRDVVDLLNEWGEDNLHALNFIDMSKVVSGSVSKDPDCRPCDLKKEFNRQINASSAVIFIVGDKTAYRTAGSNCPKAAGNYLNLCTPYKQNTNGHRYCNNSSINYWQNPDVYEVNNYSYLRHEFEQAKKRNKKIVIVYNSTRNEYEWLPNYMKDYGKYAFPFWIYDANCNKVGNYQKIKETLVHE